MQFSELRQSPVFRTVMLFVSLLCAAVILIMLGRRNDAVTEALARQAGVLTAEEVTVSARHVSGPLTYKAVHEDERVTKGEVLLRLDDRDYRIALDEIVSQEKEAEAPLRAYTRSIAIARDNLTLTGETTRHSLESAAAALRGAEATLKRAGADFERYQDLLLKKAVSRADNDRIRNDYENARAGQIEALKTFESLSEGLSPEEKVALRDSGSARNLTPLSLRTAALEVDNMENTSLSMAAALEALRARRAQAELDLERTVLTAPCDGTVRNIFFEEGELVGADCPALVIEKDTRYFDVSLPELYAMDYSAGAKVTVKAVVSGRNYAGQVRYLNAAPSYASLRMTREQGQADLTVFEMRIDVAAPDLVPGLTLELAHE